MQRGITNVEAARLRNPTVTAGLRSILRAIVNAVRGPLSGAYTAAKVGNVTLIYGDVPMVPLELRPARKLEGGKSEQRGRAGTDGSHSHVERAFIR